MVSPGTSRLRRLLAGVVLTALTMSCATPVVTPPPTASSTPSAITSAGPPASAAAPSTAGAGASGSVSIDPSLLSMLPAQVGGIALVESMAAEGEGLGDQLLATVANRLAAAVAVNPATGDFVYATVVGLREGVMTDAVFRQWRDSFDEGACAQAGGVVGHAEASIGGRTTYIGTCGGGLHTYHVWLPATNRLVSISSVGDARFGEQLLKAMSG